MQKTLSEMVKAGHFSSLFFSFFLFYFPFYSAFLFFLFGSRELRPFTLWRIGFAAAYATLPESNISSDSIGNGWKDDLDVEGGLERLARKVLWPAISELSALWRLPAHRTSRDRLGPQLPSSAGLKPIRKCPDVESRDIAPQAMVRHIFLLWPLRVVDRSC
jgi:hypothetical protein